MVDNESSDGTGALVAERFPQARVVRCPNRGFPHANNRALMTPMARYVLFLNPDTEIVDGDFGALVEMLDGRPTIGLLGVKQLTGDGELYPTMRRFPNAARAMAEALTSERWPLRPAWLGERDLRLERYERELECDWTVGAYMLARREALLGAGFMDERFFLFSDEPDLCLRIRRAGWRIVHSPAMTIVHHAGKAGVKPRLVAQEVLRPPAVRREALRRAAPGALRGRGRGAPRRCARHARRARPARRAPRRRARPRCARCWAAPSRRSAHRRPPRSTRRRSIRAPPKSSRPAERESWRGRAQSRRSPGQSAAPDGTPLQPPPGPGVTPRAHPFVAPRSAPPARGASAHARRP